MSRKPTAPWCVLIVDDDAEFRDVLAAMLVDAGHVVEHAGDGPEALARLAGRDFDVVLLDVNLPSMNGLDVLAQIRGSLQPPLVVIMTGDDTPEALLEAVRRQAYRFPRKPLPLRNDHRGHRRCDGDGAVRRPADPGRVGAP